MLDFVRSVRPLDPLIYSQNALSFAFTGARGVILKFTAFVVRSEGGFERNFVALIDF